MTDRSAPTSSSQQRHGMSLGGRLSLGFGLIALLFLIANAFSQHNAALVNRRIQETTKVSADLNRVAQKLSDSLAAYQRGVTGKDGIVAKSNVMAEDALLDAVLEYEALRSPIAENVPPQTLRTAIDELRDSVQSLASDVKRRDELLDRYWKSFDRLHKQLTDADSSGWHIGDRIITRQSTTTVANALLNVRSVVSTYLASPSHQRAAAIELQEKRFLATLNQNAKTLSGVHGDIWLAGIRTDFMQLKQMLQEAQTAKDRADKKSAIVTAAFQSLAKTVRTGISEPAINALAESAQEASAIAQRTDKQIAIASVVILALIVVIAIVTVISVAKPVDRLMRATNRFAAGDESARAQRGGMRELDQLSAAFNSMADRLSATQREMRSDQARLEERVVQRTEQLEHLAYHDALTQLPNRRGLFQHLAMSIDQLQHREQRLALFLLDLDNFKILNDSVGHLFGDRVLQAVSSRLLDAVKGGSFAARLGGDEFTVVCEVGGDDARIVQLAEDLLARFKVPLHVDDREIIVNISVGASVFPDHAQDAESLLRAADGALFKAKELGRNRMCVASAALLEEIGGRFKTEQALRRAKQCNELELLYQPQMSLSTGQVNAVEALLRWKRNGQYVAPMEFLPLAEQSGLLAEITDWVLQRAVQTLAEWHRGAWPDARIAVNISAQQLIDQTFVYKLKSLLALYKISPASLELELTETVLQSGIGTVNALRELRELGVGIALDDFGAGYSSLASLEQFALSRVKIDRSLIENVDQEPRSASIARSMIALCHSLNLAVTVEGVERREQLHFLSRCESVDVQGYLLARPLPLDQVPIACKELPLRLPQLRAVDESSAMGKSNVSSTVVQWRGPPPRKR